MRAKNNELDTQKIRILHVEDDLQYRELLPDYLGREDFEVISCSSADAAENHLMENGPFDCAVLDMMLPQHSEIKDIKKANVGIYGYKIARKAKEHNEQCWVVGTSKAPTISDAEQSFIDLFIGKVDVDPYLRTLSRVIRNQFELGRKFDTSCFIVHGHNHELVSHLQTWLEVHSSFDNVTILSKSPGPGLSIIEKFEKYAHQADAVFVLLTRDDKAISLSEVEQMQIDAFDDGDKLRTLNQMRYRARQNVIFEAGYFFGKLGRSAGRVILLYEGGLELPTDMSGMIYVDITNGISNAHEDLELELKGFLR